jgi:phosphoribosylamine--glycine ligase
MNILIVGSGGREHAMAWKLKQSPRCGQLFVAPGNAGTAAIAVNLPLGVENFAGLGDACLAHNIGLVVVGPEVPLVNGIRDYFESNEQLKNIPLVGPGKAGAQLEGSKEYSKSFMLRNSIPTAKARTFGAAQMQDALAYLQTCRPPIVLKADGLAAGKGVIICLSVKEAVQELNAMLLRKKFGTASARVLIEEFLNGIELSVFVLTDGQDYVVLPEAKDYKRVGDNDTGLNTGGMGAISPVAFADQVFMRKVEDRVILPTLRGLRSEGVPYKGFLFIGLMNVGGNPYVIEYNVRMGDPETQVVLPRIESDFLELLFAAATGTLASQPMKTSEDFAVTVFMVSGGYPGDYQKGFPISGLEGNANAIIFHAGTRREGDEIITDGGRVLAVTARASTLSETREKVYKALSAIRWEGVYYRQDIGLDLMRIGSA